MVKSRRLFGVEGITINKKFKAVRQLKGAISLEVLHEISQTADCWFKKIDQISSDHGAWSVAEYLPVEARYLPSARSISLAFVVDISVLLDAFSASLKQYLVKELGPAAVCDVDLAWLRRQYPPSMRPQASAPHNWHQDGAYGFNFSQQHPGDEGALIPMLTLWAPLHPCGDVAPGLELLGNTDRALLDLDSLSDVEISKRWSYSERWRPVMNPGDVLLIKSHVIHRTHVHARMTQLRGCVELRFFPENSIPSRIAEHQFLSMD
jgi:hypothetical protein